MLIKKINSVLMPDLEPKFGPVPIRISSKFSKKKIILANNHTLFARCGDMQQMPSVKQYLSFVTSFMYSTQSLSTSTVLCVDEKQRPNREMYDTMHISEERSPELFRISSALMSSWGWKNQKLCSRS